MSGGSDPAADPVRLNRLRKRMRDQLLAVVVRAHRDDPLLRYVLAERSDRLWMRRWLGAVSLRCGLAVGEVYATHRLEGVAVWLSPDHSTPGLWGMLRSGMFVTPMVLGSPAFERLAVYMAYTAKVRHATLPVDHWYLLSLAVDPACQRQGWAGQLIQPVLNRADSSGLPCYLETVNPGARALYARYGFHVVERATPAAGGPPFWAMVRDPRRTPTRPTAGRPTLRSTPRARGWGKQPR